MMRKIVLQTIQDIKNEKEVSKQYPTHALRLEVLKRIYSQADKALTDLAKKKMLRTGDTIKDKYFELIHTNNIPK